MKKRHVGQILKRQYLDRQNLSVNDLIFGTGISAQEVHNVIDGSAPITLDMSEKLNKFFNIADDSMFWLRLQNTCDTPSQSRKEIARPVDKDLRMPYLRIHSDSYSSLNTVAQKKILPE